MATSSHSESRRLYSWWWDSHNTPKNSKWLQENITDMDGKVKSMIKLIEEDADSFARRAEMYYKKRPELMKLVEEFYRAYRALAERYNHATGELHHAHTTIAAAFPDQVPFELIQDSPSKMVDPDVVLEKMGLSLSLKEDSDGGMDKRGLKQLKDMFGAKESADKEESSRDAVMQLSTENQNLKDKILGEIERAGHAERDICSLKKALADMEAEKEHILLRYNECLEKIPKMEGELSSAQMDSMRLNEKAGRAEIEVQTLKEALIQLESEMVKFKEYLEKIACLETLASQLQEESKALDNRTFAAESLAQSLKDEVSALELKKEGVECGYKQCLGKISELENIISCKEDEASMLKKQLGRAESEVSELKKAVADLNKEREASALEYKHCLETIAKLEKEICSAKEEVERLNSLVLLGTSKLKMTEDKCNLLAVSNQALRVEADNLAKKIEMKDKELGNKEEKLEKLQSCLQDENAHHAEIEATLEGLQNLHTQSQDDQRALAVELRNMIKMLDDVQASKHGLEEELQQVKDENHSLRKTSFSSSLSMENMQTEVYSLREIRERLEKEVSHHIGISVSLQHEISCLKEEIERLNKSYQALVKSSQDENSRLKEMQEQDSNEKVLLLKKIENIEELLKKKVKAEISLSGLNDELEISRQKVKALQESSQLLHEEKATLAAEKASLLSHLQVMTENMNHLLGQNYVLENSLSTAKVELESLREKSKGLEEICDLLKNERSFLLSERDTLVLKLENMERKLESLEKKFTRLGEEYADLEKENEAIHFQVEKLKVKLGVEKQERLGKQLLSEARMAGLEKEIHLLQEENKWKKKESEQELEKALKAQFEISILQKFMKDMESKNYSLIIECQKHVEASNLAEKVISELENESLQQQMEAELLLDEIGRLRMGIYQIFTTLESSSDCSSLENEQTLVNRILGSVEDMKRDIAKHDDEKQLLFVENSVLEALIEQLQCKGMEIELQKLDLYQEAEIMAEKLAFLNNEKEELLEINRQLETDANKGYQRATMLQAELESICIEQCDLQTAYNALQEAHSQAKQENASMLKKFSDLTEEKCLVDQHNDDILMDFFSTANQSAVLKCFSIEKLIELSSLLEDLNKQHEINSCLVNEMNEMGRKLDLQKAENVSLKDAVCRLEREMQEVRECSLQMKQDMTSTTESLIQTKAKLFDTEMQLEATEKLNSTLFRTIAELKIDLHRSNQVNEDLEKNVVHLSETNSSQMKEIDSLHKVKKELESELRQLHEEIKENTVRERTLSMEIQGMNNEFELWEDEAASFCFDLQVSSVQEVLLKDKVQELTRACQKLEHKHAAKTSEVEQMRGTISHMENEINRLKSQVSAYAPIIASLTDDVALIEQNAFLHSKLKSANNQGTEFLEFDVHTGEATSQKPMDHSLLSLENLQKKVKVVYKLIEETNKPLSLRRSNLNLKSKQEPLVDEVGLSRIQLNLGGDKQECTSKKAYTSDLTGSPRLQKTKAKEVKSMMLMKDIPLDEASDSSMRKKDNAFSADLMLELWETEDENTDQTISEVEYTKGKSKSYLPPIDPDMEKDLGVDKLELLSPQLNDVNILERLHSDADKLHSLQTTLYTLRRKMEANKKSKKGRNIDCETVKEQLQEAEDSLAHLVDLNVQLVKNIEECPPDGTASPRLKETVKTWRIKVMENAEKGSQRLEMLQLAVHRIEFVLSKLDDEGKVGNKFLKSRTIILRDFIHGGKRNSGRRKKGPNCGCLRQSTSGNRSRS